MTLISVITPNYNYGKYLREALDSILTTNKCDEYEIVVVDDGSTDDSAAILRKYENDHRVRAFYHAQNRGIAESVNFAMAQAKGAFLHPFSSDDVHEPGAIDLMAEKIKQFPQALLFASDYTTFEETGEQRHHRQFPATSASYYTPGQVMQLFRQTDFWISGHTVFFHKRACIHYDARLSSICDWLNYHVLALDQGMCYLPQSLINVRMHSQSYSSQGPLIEKRKMWLSLLENFDTHPQRYQALIQSGICRMLGLKAIYMDLLRNPRYWGYLYPMITREIKKHMN